ncbi:hypothetical protein BCR36DRAFT_277920, partial [Piromyces finnis]
ETIDFSRYLSQNSFFPPTPENNFTYKFYTQDEGVINKFKTNNSSIINRIEVLKESLIDIISKSNNNIIRFKSNANDISNSCYNNYQNNTKKIFFDEGQINNINDILKPKINNYLNKKEIHIPFKINCRNNSYLNYISVNNKKNVFLNISNKFEENNLKIKETDNHENSIYISKSLIQHNNIKNINGKEKLKMENEGYNEKSHQLNTSSSLTYDKSTFMSNKTYVNNSFDKSHSNIDMNEYKKILGEINNTLDSRNKTTNRKNSDTINNNVSLISSFIGDNQISTIGYKIFPETFDKTLSYQVTSPYIKKTDCFKYNGFFDEDNDPFNSRFSQFDFFDKSYIENENENESIKSHIFIENNEKKLNKKLSNIIEKGDESSFIDFKPYKLYMNAFYSRGNFEFPNSQDSNQGINDKNTLLTRDVKDTLSFSSSNLTSSFISTDSSFEIKKADLDIRFTQDNQLKAEHIANMTPGTFFGSRSAPLGCLDGESLTPSQRPLYKYFTPRSELIKEFSLSDIDSENIVSTNKENIFHTISNINKKDNFLIFEDEDKLNNREDENNFGINNKSFLKPTKDLETTKHESNFKKSLSSSLKRKIKKQTVVFLSTVMSQTSFDQQKYFIDFGSIKINTRKHWDIVLKCDILKVINWQLTQEKTILKKKISKNGNGNNIMQTHTLDIDSFSVNYTHGKVNPNREKKITLSFFPTATGKYYKKIIINIGRHKILFNIEGYSISTNTSIKLTNNYQNNKYILLN